MNTSKSSRHSSLVRSKLPGRPSSGIRRQPSGFMLALSRWPPEQSTPTTRKEMTTAARFPALHHVTLKTTRLDEMIDWYRNAVGMEPNFKFPGGAWTSNDE